MTSLPMKKDYFWNAVGVFAQVAISPLLIIAVTRINGVDDSGLVSFAFAVSLIFWAIGSWGGRTYQVSDIAKEFEQRSYIMVRLVLGVAVLAGALLFCIVNNYDGLKSAVILSLVFFKVLESVADAIYGILQAHGRLYITGKSLLYKALFGFALFLLIDFNTDSVPLSSLGFIISNAFFLFVYDIPNAIKFEKVLIPVSQTSHYFHDAVTIIKRCAPIATMIFLSMFSLNIPRYFLDMYHEDQIGYYGILVMPITVLGLFITFIMQPNIVKLTEYFTTKKYDKFKNIVTNLQKSIIILGMAVAVATYLIGVEALRFIFGIDFSAYKDGLMILIFGAILNACVMMYLNIFTIARRFKEQFFALVSTNIILTFLCIEVVKQYGLTGGITLFAVANAVQLLLLVLSYKKMIREVSK